MPDSPLAPYIEPLIFDLQNAFTNQLSRQGEYRDGDVLPGERVATMVLQTLRPNPDYKLQDTRAGISLWMFEFQAAIAVGVSTAGMAPMAAQFKVDAVAAGEMFNLPHAIASMKRDFDSYGLVHDVRVRYPIDTAPSVLIDDRTVWIANVTALIEVWIAVRRDENGEYTTLLQG